MANIVVIDKKSKTYLVNTAAFRLPSPEGHIFESGVKYKMDETEWTKSQPAILVTTEDEDVDDKVLKPNAPRSPQIDPEKA